jgi:hypothetical protein
MASRIVVHDTLQNAPALLVISRAGKHIQINEFDLTIDQALLVVGDLLDTIKAAALAEAESALYHRQVPIQYSKSVGITDFSVTV